MKMVPYSIDKLTIKRRNDNRILLEEFVESGYPCVKLEGWKHKEARHCQTSLLQSISRFHMSGVVGVITRNGEVFLVNKLLMESSKEES